MKPISAVLLSVIALVAIVFTYASGFQISNHVSSLSNNVGLTRVKREMENFDDYAVTATGREDQQEEPGFWDRIIRVALKLFSHLIQWINS